MNSAKLIFDFSGEIWQHDGPGAWFFVSLPEKVAYEIRSVLKSEEEGWGRLKVSALIGNSEWKTAIWFDSKRNTYLLPLKSEIRKQESLQSEQLITVRLII